MRNQPSRPAGHFPEPALRPRASRGPGLRTVRRARFFYESAAYSEAVRDGRGALVLSRGTRRRRLLKVGGEGGVASCVCVEQPGGSEDAEIGNDWPRLEFRDGRDRPLARLDVGDWLPEAARLDSRGVPRADVLKRAGVTGLLERARVPLRVEQHDGGERRESGTCRTGVAARFPRREGPGGLRPGAFFPAWYVVVLCAALAVWFALFTVMALGFYVTAFTVLSSAFAVATAPLARMALRVQCAGNDWRTRLDSARRFGPRPAPGAGVTVRFRRRAAVYVTEQDLVLRDFTGGECWLPRRGPHGVVRLVRVLGRSGGVPLGVECVMPDGTVRERLDWEAWFGGEEGESQFRALCAASGLAGGERRLTGRKAWSAHDATLYRGEDALRLSPPAEPREARRVARFPHALSYAPLLMFVAAFGLLEQTFGRRDKFSSEPSLPGHPEVKLAVLVCTLLVLTEIVVPFLFRQLRSRLWLERTDRCRERAGG